MASNNDEYRLPPPIGNQVKSEKFSRNEDEISCDDQYLTPDENFPSTNRANKGINACNYDNKHISYEDNYNNYQEYQYFDQFRDRADTSHVTNEFYPDSKISPNTYGYAPHTMKNGRNFGQTYEKNHNNPSFDQNGKNAMHDSSKPYHDQFQQRYPNRIDNFDYNGSQNRIKQNVFDKTYVNKNLERYPLYDDYFDDNFRNYKRQPIKVNFENKNDGNKPRVVDNTTNDQNNKNIQKLHDNFNNQHINDQIQSNNHVNTNNYNDYVDYGRDDKYFIDPRLSNKRLSYRSNDSTLVNRDNVDTINDDFYNLNFDNNRFTNKYSSNTDSSRRKKDPPTFTGGTPQEYVLFRSNFLLHCKWSRWSEEERHLQLSMALRGDAHHIVLSNPYANFEQLMRACDDKYINPRLVDVHINNFETRHLK